MLFRKSLLLTYFILLGPTLFVKSQSSKIVINEIGAYDEKKNPDWVEIYNSGNDTIDLAGWYWTTSKSKDKYQKIPPSQPSLTKISPKSYTCFKFNGVSQQSDPLVVGFKLQKEGGYIGLHSPNKKLVSKAKYPRQKFKSSFGRNNSNKWRHFAKPTPGSANTSQSFKGLCSKPKSNVKSGIIEEPFVLELTSSTKRSSIYFTLDGSTPSQKNGTRYSKPIKIDSTCTLRAICIKNDFLSSSVLNRHYIIDANHELPIISIAVDSFKSYYHFKVKEDTDIPIIANAAFFETDSSKIFETDFELTLAGGGSRHYPQKSISLHTKPYLNSKKIKHKLYLNKPSQRIKGMVLRNAGNGAPKTQFKDAFMQNLASKNVDADFLAYRPVVAYINGEYWGIYNIREKKCKHYFEENHEVEGDSIDYLMNHSYRTLRGSDEDYKELIQYVSDHNLAEQIHYDEVTQRIDIDNFIDYQITELYVSNTDWPMSNTRIWRPRTKDGKWRWLLFDLDHGYRETKISHNSIEYARGINNWHKKQYQDQLTKATLLFRKLYENEDFKKKFVSRFADLLNTNFSAEYALQVIDSMKIHYDTEMQRHIDRWTIEGQRSDITSLRVWERGVDDMRSFAKARTDTIRKFIIDDFNLSGESTVKITSNESAAAEIKVNSLNLDQNNEWSGIYFKDIPINITIKINDGYELVSCEGLIMEQNQGSLIPKNDEHEITLLFKRKNEQNEP